MKHDQKVCKQVVKIVISDDICISKVGYEVKFHREDYESSAKSCLKKKALVSNHFVA